MSLNKWCVAIATLALAGACGDSDPTDASAEHTAASASDSGAKSGTTAPGAQASSGTTHADGAAPSHAAAPDASTGGAHASTSDAGTAPASSGDAGNTGVPQTGPTQYDYQKQDVAVAKDLVIPAGKTVRVGPGVTFNAKTDVKIQVLGTLIVEGSTDAPVSFLGAGEPRSWYGIVIESGGELLLSQAKIGGASYGLYAKPGSKFSVDHAVIGTSFKAAIIQSDGSFAHTLFNASTPDSISLADDVSVDDPNGTLTIMDASPQVSDCEFNGSSGFTDMVRIGGKSSPTFDHVYLHGAHCGFHTFGGANTSPKITNAIFENLAYGIMAYTTKPIIEDSVFRSNSTDIGMCTDATADNVPMLKNNNYESGSASIDASCFRIGAAEPNPATTPNPKAGPSGL